MTENNEIPLRVAFYLRVSSEDQAEKYGIDLQEQALEGLIRSKGKLRDGVTDAMKKVEVYKDEGISGQKK
jgi:DNA invertase Pin-like site-specific DNA recombinase